MTDDIEQPQQEQKAPYRFVPRVLAVSFPTALMLLSFVSLDEVNPLSAILGFCMVVSFNVILTMPFLTNLQNLTQYTDKLAKNEDISSLPEIGNDNGHDESAQIVQAITQMRSIWISKAERLEAQTISDSAVLDSLPDPLLMLNNGGEIIGANQVARSLFGENIREKKLKNLFYTPSLLAAAEDVLSGAETHQALELVLGYKVFNVKIERLPASADGNVVALSLYDITPQKKLEQAQIDFIANASHELKTPLSVLSGFIETLQTTAKDDPKAQEEFLKIMQTQALRMAKLIENLLSLSKIQMNEHDTVSETVDVCDILKTVQYTLQEKAKQRDVTISVKTCKPENPVLGDAGELTQVFQNLIDNAVKYCDEASQITIVCRNEDAPDPQKTDGAERLFCVTVHNMGNPIPADVQPRLTERFFRVNSIKNKASGTGLGLAIVAQILKHHHGFLEIESSAVEGTNFTVCLPMKAPVPVESDTSDSAVSE